MVRTGGPADAAPAPASPREAVGTPPAGWTVLAVVLRLQVQRSRLKAGPAATRRYDPAPLIEVQALRIGPRGVIGERAGQDVADVHHADHPDSRNVLLRNGLSLLPQCHYERLRTRYGPHLVDGSAGESLLLSTAAPWSATALAGTVLLEVDGGLLALTDGAPAPPCLEFTRFVLGRAAGDTGPQVRAALSELADGARGFYARTAGAGTVRPGARLWQRPAGSTATP